MSFCREERRIGFPRAALSAPDAPVPGKQPGPGGRFIVSVSELLAVSTGFLGLGKGLCLRGDTAKRSAHSSLWPQPGAESHVRRHHGELEIQQELGLGG